MRFLFLVGIVLTAAQAIAQRGGGGGGQNPPLASLKTVAPPTPTGVDRYVLDQTALIVLGKALFWDVQAGSDGRTACATCHFHAGADHRLQNQLASPHDGTATVVPNRTLTLADFPFRSLANTTNNASAVIRDSRQVAGSAGVFRFDFLDV